MRGVPVGWGEVAWIVHHGDTEDTEKTLERGGEGDGERQRRGGWRDAGLQLAGGARG